MALQEDIGSSCEIKTSSPKAVDRFYDDDKFVEHLWKKTKQKNEEIASRRARFFMNANIEDLHEKSLKILTKNDKNGLVKSAIDKPRVSTSISKLSDTSDTSDTNTPNTTNTEIKLLNSEHKDQTTCNKNSNRTSKLFTDLNNKSIDKKARENSKEIYICCLVNEAVNSAMKLVHKKEDYFERDSTQIKTKFKLVNSTTDITSNNIMINYENKNESNSLTRLNQTFSATKEYYNAILDSTAEETVMKALEVAKATLANENCDFITTRKNEPVNIEEVSNVLTISELVTELLLNGDYEVCDHSISNTDVIKDEDETNYFDINNDNKIPLTEKVTTLIGAAGDKAQFNDHVIVTTDHLDDVINSDSENNDIEITDNEVIQIEDEALSNLTSSQENNTKNIPNNLDDVIRHDTVCYDVNRIIGDAQPIQKNRVSLIPSSSATCQNVRSYFIGEKNLFFYTADGITKNSANGVIEDSTSGVTKDCSRGVTKDNTSGVIKDCSSGVSKENTSGVTTDCSPGVTTDCSRGVTTDCSRGVTKDNTSGLSKNNTSDVTKDCANAKSKIVKNEEKTLILETGVQFPYEDRFNAGVNNVYETCEISITLPSPNTDSVDFVERAPGPGHAEDIELTNEQTQNATPDENETIQNNLEVSTHSVLRRKSLDFTDKKRYHPILMSGNFFSRAVPFEVDSAGKDDARNNTRNTQTNGMTLSDDEQSSKYMSYENFCSDDTTDLTGETYDTPPRGSSMEDSFESKLGENTFLQKVTDKLKRRRSSTDSGIIVRTPSVKSSQHSNINRTTSEKIYRRLSINSLNLWSFLRNNKKTKGLKSNSLPPSLRPSRNNKKSGNISQAMFESSLEETFYSMPKVSDKIKTSSDLPRDVKLRSFSLNVQDDDDKKNNNVFGVYEDEEKLKVRRFSLTEPNSSNIKRFDNDIGNKTKSLPAQKRFKKQPRRSIQKREQEILPTEFYMSFDVNTKDNHGNSCMHHASQTGDVATIMHLLKQGGDVWLKNTDNLLPIDLASNFQTAKLLSQATLFYNERSHALKEPNILQTKKFITEV